MKEVALNHPIFFFSLLLQPMTESGDTENSAKPPTICGNVKSLVQLVAEVPASFPRVIGTFDRRALSVFLENLAPNAAPDLVLTVHKASFVLNGVVCVPNSNAMDLLEWFLLGIADRLVSSGDENIKSICNAVAERVDDLQVFLIDYDAMPTDDEKSLLDDQESGAEEDSDNGFNTGNSDSSLEHDDNVSIAS